MRTSQTTSNERCAAKLRLQGRTAKTQTEQRCAAPPASDRQLVQTARRQTRRSLPEQVPARGLQSPSESRSARSLSYPFAPVMLTVHRSTTSPHSATTAFSSRQLRSPIL